MTRPEIAALADRLQPLPDVSDDEQIEVKAADLRHATSALRLSHREGRGMSTNDGVAFDKNGRPIERGDVLKVYHFTGLRRKRHYMYKQALGPWTTRDGTTYMRFGHLDLGDEHYVEPTGRILKDYEIVQSIDCKFEDRPKRPSQAEDEG
jgi:hypothetical protein